MGGIQSESGFFYVKGRRFRMRKNASGGYPALKSPCRGIPSLDYDHGDALKKATAPPYEWRASMLGRDGDIAIEYNNQ